jgi:hypothetical protein
LRVSTVPEILAADTSELLEQDISAWSESYRTARPYPHIVLDGLFPVQLLDRVLEEIKALQVEPEKNIYGSFRKHRTSELRRMGPTTRRFIEELNSAPFIEFLERLTGIEHLVPDPHLEGGGIHQIGNGGFLKVHTDFNWHRKLNLHRRLNILIYLNPGWKEEWNGALELWDQEMKAAHQKIAPVFGRTVVFSTTDHSYHGHPDPLTSPDGVLRNSIALYYYSAERPREEVAFDASTMTNYRERPNERFEGGKLKHRLHQFLIRHPRLRSALKRITGA